MPLPAAHEPSPPVALYVHFPFCLSICPYCDFVVVAGAAARGPASRIDAFVDVLVREIELRAPARRSELGSVYFGGGTPSLMSPAHVERLLTVADSRFGIAANAEITLEANPGAAERGDMAGFRAAGVNRLSIGAQSMVAGELRRLGRRHSAADVRHSVHDARAAGFESVSIDLLYDVPGQTVASWRTSLEAVLALAPDHVSAYALTLDDPDAEGLTGTSGDHLPLREGARRWRSRARADQDEDRAADMYLLADELLAAAGLPWYELSNWSRAGRESRHNLVYWLGGAWEAVGPGAHAFDGARRRRWNAARLDAYMAALSDGKLPPGGWDAVGSASADAERAILRLRTAGGLPPTAVRGGLQRGVEWGTANGLLEPAGDGGRRLSLRGRLLANELFSVLLPPAEAAAPRRARQTSQM